MQRAVHDAARMLLHEAGGAFKEEKAHEESHQHEEEPEEAADDHGELVEIAVRHAQNVAPSCNVSTKRTMHVDSHCVATE